MPSDAFSVTDAPGPADPAGASEPQRITRVVLEATDPGWASPLRRGPRADTTAMRLRRALGLPTDTPIIGTGHQPGPWHAGITAKVLAASAIAEALAADPANPAPALAFVVVDHQPVPATIRLPVRDASGTLIAVDRPLPAAPAADASDRAIGWLPAAEPITWEALSQGLAIDPAGTLLGVYHDTLRAARAADTLADQLARATAAILADRVGQNVELFSVSALARTPEFIAFVHAMLDDPDGCVRAYNAAAAGTPSAGVPQLDLRDRSNPELPLWLIDPAGRSRRAYLHETLSALTDAENASASPSARPQLTIAPRAIAMSGFVRRYAVDAFIHGTGGGVYDTIAERWLHEWLGWTLAPMLVVTADVELPIHAQPTTEADLARAQWTLHHAAHNPGAVGDAERARQKRDLVARIAASVQAGHDAHAGYAQLHDLLRAHRQANSSALAELADRVAGIRARLRERELATDRSWTAALHTPATLDALRARLAALVAERLARR